jgi:hemerythrin HHE cation binding domain-containing protein
LSELREFLERDHERLDRLLSDERGYPEFRSGLLWHIGVEEKILFPYLRRTRGESELLNQLHRDHAALGALLVPPPNPKIIEQIRAILIAHNPLEEGPGGLYEQVEDADLLEAVRAFPPVRVAPHADSEITRASIEELLRQRQR